MENSYIDDEMNDYISERCVLFENLLTDKQCDDALDMFNQYDADLGVVGDEYGAVVKEDNNLRKCYVTYIDNNPHTKWIHDICEEALTEANNTWKFDIRDFSQPMRMMDYVAGSHFKSWHQDHGPGQTCYRKLTIVVQLDRPGIDFEGGEFEIAGGPVPEGYFKRGAGIVFPTYYYHRVAPITKGHRRSIVHRAIGPHFR